jgi:hypothetical protein
MTTGSDLPSWVGIVVPLVVALVAYAVGVLRPVAVRADCITGAATLELVARIRNRRLKVSRQLTGLSLVTVPGDQLFRIAYPFWRRRMRPSTEGFQLVYGDVASLAGGRSIAARDTTVFRAAIGDQFGNPLPGTARLPPNVWIEASFGTRRSIRPVGVRDLRPAPAESTDP